MVWFHHEKHKLAIVWLWLLCHVYQFSETRSNMFNVLITIDLLRVQHLIYVPHRYWDGTCRFINVDLGARCRYQGQGQITTFHRYSTDTCNYKLHSRECSCRWPSQGRHHVVRLRGQMMIYVSCSVSLIVSYKHYIDYMYYRCRGMGLTCIMMLLFYTG